MLLSQNSPGVASNPWSMMGPAASNVSHMSSDQYEEQNLASTKSEQFF